jgi:glutamate-1-semialdehyde aminotransferase
MRERGVLLPPSQLECAFLSLAHDDADIDAIGDAADRVLVEMAR